MERNKITLAGIVDTLGTMCENMVMGGKVLAVTKINDGLLTIIPECVVPQKAMDVINTFRASSVRQPKWEKKISTLDGGLTSEDFNALLQDDASDIENNFEEIYFKVAMLIIGHTMYLSDTDQKLKIFKCDRGYVLVGGGHYAVMEKYGDLKQWENILGEVKKSIAENHKSQTVMVGSKEDRITTLLNKEAVADNVNMQTFLDVFLEPLTTDTTPPKEFPKATHFGQYGDMDIWMDAENYFFVHPEGANVSEANVLDMW